MPALQQARDVLSCGVHIVPPSVNIALEPMSQGFFVDSGFLVGIGVAVGLLTLTTEQPMIKYWEPGARGMQWTRREAPDLALHSAPLGGEGG